MSDQRARGARVGANKEDWAIRPGNYDLQRELDDRLVVTDKESFAGPLESINSKKGALMPSALSAGKRQASERVKRG